MPHAEPAMIAKSLLVGICVLHKAAAFSSVPAHATDTCEEDPITMHEVEDAQQEWGAAIVRISSSYLSGGDYVATAADAADLLYGYGRTNVLFKPTKAAEHPFRPTATGALSYFVGGDVVTGGYAEDSGFALGPDHLGWTAVSLEDHQVDLYKASAHAMGEYFFTAADGNISKVEYTFGYKRNEDGKARIFLHHSSLPFSS